MANISYLRVSTTDQTVENQRIDIQKTYKIDKEFIDEGVSGTTLACEREGFAAMLDYIREGDTLITVDIDRLGRDAIDIQTTIAKLKAKGVNVIVTRLGIDLSTDAGQIVIAIMATMAEMERKKMLERQKVGITRAKEEGKFKGRPQGTCPKAVREARKTMTIAQTAEHFGISKATVNRLQKSTDERVAVKKKKQAA